MSFRNAPAILPKTVTEKSIRDKGALSKWGGGGWVGIDGDSCKGERVCYLIRIGQRYSGDGTLTGIEDWNRDCSGRVAASE